MKTLYISSKKHSYEVIVNADNTLFISADGVNNIPNIGNFILSMGGVDKVLDRCVDRDDYDSIVELRKAESEVMRKDMAEKKAEHDAYEKARLDRIYSDYKALGDGVIEVNEKSLKTILDYLNTMNWGVWSLPKTNIGISYAQHDCDGVLTTTANLDSPVNGKTMFKVGSRRGLPKYELL